MGQRHVVIEDREVMYFDGLQIRFRPAIQADYVREASMNPEVISAPAPVTTPRAVTVVDDDSRPTLSTMRPEVDKAIETIIRDAQRLSLGFAEDDDQGTIFECKDGELPIPRFPSKDGYRGGAWTLAERTTLAAAIKYYYSRALGLRDNPEPEGEHRSDASAWLRMFKSGIPIGKHRACLSRMPQWERGVLEASRTSGNEVLLPHPAHAESLPRYLRVEEIERRFGVERVVAEQFQLYFMILELAPDIIDRLAAEVRLWTKVETCTPEQLSKRKSQYHPDVLLLEYNRLSRAMLELEPEDEELLGSATRHFDTDLGRRDPGQVAVENDIDLESEAGGDIPEDEMDLVSVEHDDEPEAIDPESEESEGAEGAFEAIAYHRLGRGDCEPDDRLDQDPLYQQIINATPADVGRLKQLLYQEQQAQKTGVPQTAKSKAKSFYRTYTQWTYLWLLLKAREKHYQDTTLNRLVFAVDHCPTYWSLKGLGSRMFAEMKPWPQAARKKYWAAYNKQKTEFESRLKSVPRKPHKATAAAA